MAPGPMMPIFTCSSLRSSGWSPQSMIPLRSGCDLAIGPDGEVGVCYHLNRTSGARQRPATDATRL